MDVWGQPTNKPYEEDTYEKPDSETDDARVTYLLNDRDTVWSWVCCSYRHLG
jgi:hypothetical protein